MNLPTLRLDEPWALAALILLPLTIYQARQSLSGLGPVRSTLSIVLRCLLQVVLILIVARPEMVQKITDRAVVFLVDVSRSVAPSQQAIARRFVAGAAKTTRPGKDRVGVVAFAAKPAIEQLPRSVIGTGQVDGSVEADATDLGAALRLGQVCLPGDAVGRIVLLSDGNENAGVSSEAVRSLTAAGVPVDVVPLAHVEQREVMVDRLTAPALARPNEVVDLNLVINATASTQGRLYLFHDDVAVDLDKQSDGPWHAATLSPGKNRFVLPVEMKTGGAHRFRVQFDPDNKSADGIVENNQASACTIVTGRESVLFVIGRPDDPALADESKDALIAALRSQQVDCDVRDLSEVTFDAAGLATRPLVVLSNVSAADLSEASQQALASYVRDLGGGLLVIGGDQAYSTGGYGGTTLETLLPVYTNRDKLVYLSTALVVVVDKSGSMVGPKIAMAREAAIRSARLLSSLDYIGVVAFDTMFDWVVPLTQNQNKDSVTQRIQRIDAGGGTNLCPALEQAAKALMGVNANVRHIIALTDGQSMPGDFDKVAQWAAERRISISTVAVGADADFGLLERIAKRAKGRAYKVDTADKIPRIFVRETALVSRSGLYEKPFTPVLRPTPDDEPTAGIPTGALPRLRGYVLSAARPEATVAITGRTTGRDDPILAYWQVGLGRTVAFTSGIWNRWGPDWVAWSSFNKLWAQTVRWASRPASLRGWSVTSSVENGRVHLSAEAEPSVVAAGRYPDLQALVVKPNGERMPVRLSQVGPGQFDAVFDAKLPGDYIVRIADSVAGGSFVSVVSVSCPEELRTTRADAANLRQIATGTGGRMLDPDRPEDVLAVHDDRVARAHTPIQLPLLYAATLLFLMDVAVRRIVIDPARTRAWLRRWVGSLAWAGRGRQAEGVLESLRSVKSKARSEQAEREAGEGRLPPRSGRAYGDGRQETGGATAGPDARARFETRPGATSGERPVEAAGTGTVGGSQGTSATAGNASSKDQTTEPPASHSTARLLSTKRRLRKSEDSPGRE